MTQAHETLPGADSADPGVPGSGGTASLTFRAVPHPSGALTIYTATTATHVIEIYEVKQAAQARTRGTWFMHIRVHGAALSVSSQHFTKTAARDFAQAVLAATTGPTHADLAAARDLVGDEPVIESSPATEDLAPAAPAAERRIVVIACGAAKLDHAAPADQLYTSDHFKLVLRAARRLADEQTGRVVILSAENGIVECDRQLDPYDVKMGDPAAITPVAIAAQLANIAPSSITALLPRAYAAALTEAATIAGAPTPINLFADTPGIGYQRAIAARLAAA